MSSIIDNKCIPCSENVNNNTEVYSIGDVGALTYPYINLESKYPLSSQCIFINSNFL